MTLQLNFDKTKMKFLIVQIKWLQEIGLITSFKIDKPEDDELEGEFDLSDEEVEALLKVAKEVKNGDFITLDKLKKELKYN